MAEKYTNRVVEFVVAEALMTFKVPFAAPAEQGMLVSFTKFALLLSESEPFGVRERHWLPPVPSAPVAPAPSYVEAVPNPTKSMTLESVAVAGAPVVEVSARQSFAESGKVAECLISAAGQDVPGAYVLPVTILYPLGAIVPERATVVVQPPARLHPESRYSRHPVKSLVLVVVLYSST